MKRAYQEWPTMHPKGNGTLRNFTPAVCEGWQPEGSQGAGHTRNRKADDPKHAKEPAMAKD